MNLWKTAAVIIILTLLGRLLGFVRTLYVSGHYGTGMEADAYFTALTIPMTLLLVVPGAVNAVLIPVMSGMLESGQGERARRLYQHVLAVVVALFAALSLLGIWLSPAIVGLFGLTGEKAELAAALLRWMWPSALFIGLAGLWSSVANAHRHFFTPTLGTVLNGAVVILSFYVLVPFWGIYGLAAGTTLGFLAAAVVVLPTLRGFGYRHRPVLPPRDDAELKSMGERLVPILLGAVISQVTIFLERGLTAGLGDGRIAALSYAYQIVQLPMAIFVGSFTLPLFPLLSAYVQRGELERMKQTVSKGMSVLLMLLLPVTVGLILYGDPLIRLVFAREGSAFGEQAVEWTAWGLAFYSTGLFALSARDLLTRAFYALQDTRTPVAIGVAGIGTYLACAYLAMPYLSHGGVALSMSVSALVQSLLLYAFLWKRVGQPLGKSFAVTATKVIIACAVMGAALGAAEPLLSRLPLWLHLVAGTAGGAALYGGVLILLKEPLLGEAAARVLRRKGGETVKQPDPQ